MEHCLNVLMNSPVADGPDAVPEMGLRFPDAPTHMSETGASRRYDSERQVQPWVIKDVRSRTGDCRVSLFLVSS